MKVDPPDAASGADWFTVTAWHGARQGDGGLVIRTLHRTGPGVYRKTLRDKRARSIRE